MGTVRADLLETAATPRQLGISDWGWLFAARIEWGLSGFASWRRLKLFVVLQCLTKPFEVFRTLFPAQCFSSRLNNGQEQGQNHGESEEPRYRHDGQRPQKKYEPGNETWCPFACLARRITAKFNRHGRFPRA